MSESLIILPQENTVNLIIEDGAHLIITEQAPTTLVFSDVLPSMTGDSRFRFVQSTPSTEWTIVHNLNKQPDVKVVDGSGKNTEGHIEWPDNFTVNIFFAKPVSGEAFLN
jgi:hypothetical protein